MRRITHISTLALVAALGATAAGADVFPTDSAVTAATLYPQGATILREAAFDLPAGRHSIVLTDMPLIDIDSLRLQAEGLVIGTVSYRDRAVPPSGAEEAPEIAAARQAVRDVEAQLQEVEDRARAVELAGEAARDRIDFLTRLGGTEAAGSADAARLAELLDLVGGESLKAREAAQAAAQQARTIREDRRPLEEDLKAAKAALEALLTASQDQSVLVIEVEAPEATSGQLTLSYASWQASWYPAYDAYLTTGDSPALELSRGAYLRQSTGEDWQDVAVTFSTARPSGQIMPGFVDADRLSIFDPE
uniref:mucoidy inhibitor MuiA family protein n=1 Tax=Oceanicola sp. S124 TaxID=1042378 RepID=UPI0002557901